MTDSSLFMIVPAWFSEGVEESEIQRLLSLTLADSEQIALPRNQFLYLDGVDRIRPVAEGVLKHNAPGAELQSQPDNRGKGAGVVAGLHRGLQNPDTRWFVIRDADGDHRVHDFFAMMELGRQIERECGEVPILVIGGRTRLEPPLTLYRAAYEQILNRCIDSAVSFALARQNYIPDRNYYRQYGETPDLQSGYKLYNRQAAETALQGFEEIRKTNPDIDRWGAEIVPYVSAALQRGIIGETRRSTYREQPVTAYGSIRRAEFYARKLRWVLERCEVNLWNAARLLDNELTYHPLLFDGMGKMELLSFRKAVLTPLKRREADCIPPFRQGVQFL